ncbi:hypothetical protein K3495_g442 [Podosphaera aphanis]|nr:hypothetical protein K3495_g442 [Podosphaera aphanis]
MSSTRTIQRLCRYYNTFAPIDTLLGPVTAIDLDVFQKRAFNAENPILVTAADTAQTGLPAAHKWFTTDVLTAIPDKYRSSFISQKYLAPYAEIPLPYELTGPFDKTLSELLQVNSESSNILPKIQPTDRFHHFNAPLSMIFYSRAPGLYIAQASLLDLPFQLRQDLPTPEVVKKAGKGDIYGANLWLGNPPTYTPLHKDPNPNLFLQLAGRKRVRLYNPQVGLEIFRNVRTQLGEEINYNGTFRGREMMEGIERVKLEEAVWGGSPQHAKEGIDAELGQGDCLFIPKGWWHSIKSVGNALDGDIVASVNWWFR